MSTEKYYKLWTWQDGVPVNLPGGSQNKHFEGIYSESFCRAYCRQYAGRNGLHVSVEEIHE